MLNVNQPVQTQNMKVDSSLSAESGAQSPMLQTFPGRSLIANGQQSSLIYQPPAQNYGTIVQLLQTVVVALQNIISMISGSFTNQSVANETTVGYNPNNTVQTEQTQQTPEEEPSTLQKISGWLEKAAKIGKTVANAWDSGKEYFSKIKDYASGIWEKGKEFWGNIKEGASSIWSSVKGWFSNLF